VWREALEEPPHVKDQLRSHFVRIVIGESRRERAETLLKFELENTLVKIGIIINIIQSSFSYMNSVLCECLLCVLFML
jgi:hypothetical protein